MRIPADGPGAEKKLLWVTLNGEEALEWLNNYNEGNRRVQPGKLESYVRDMKSGAWLDRSAIPVKFDWFGAMFDGQHRLWALVEANAAPNPPLSITFLVAFNCDPKERYVTDTGATRNIEDMLHFQGEHIPQSSMPTLRRMLRSFGRHSGRMSIAELMKAWEAHKDVIKWVLSTYNCHKTGLKHSAILGTVARAAYTVDKTLLKRFLEILRDGYESEHDGLIEEHSVRIVLLLRDFALDVKNKKKGGAQLDKDLYGRTQRALVAFIRREKLRELHSFESEQFALPSDDKKPAKTTAAKKTTKARIIKNPSAKPRAK